MLCACCSSASSLEIRTGFFFFASRLPCGHAALQIPLWSKPIWYSAIKFTKSHSAKCSLHKWAWLRRSIKVSSFELYKFDPFSLHSASIPRELVHSYALGLLVSCYSLLQQCRPGRLELLVNHTHTHSMSNLRWQPRWLPRLTWIPRKSRHWWRTRDSSLGQHTENKLDYNPTDFFCSPFFPPLNLELVTHLSIISTVNLHT